MAKHFFKVLGIFIGMIILGLLGLFVINAINPERGGVGIPVPNRTQVAK